MSKKLLQAAAGNAGAGALYVEDVFSTYVYEGNGTARNITNGIDLDGEGGLVWIKDRTAAGGSHALFDTNQSNPYDVLRTNSTAATYSAVTNTLTAFNTDGFTLGTDATLGWVNYASTDYASWTFRKAEKFFDVVTYTGTGTEQQIPHNLTSAAKFYVVKRTDAAGDWYVATPGLANWNNSYLVLNSTAAKVSLGDAWSTTSGAPATTFGVMDGSTNNISGATYVAYLFASNAGGFGDDGDESIIKCGSYTGTGSVPGNFIDLGFEPQWVMVKSADQTRPWVMVNNMMGMPVDGEGPRLLANDSAGEVSNASFLAPRATGFEITKQNTYVNTSGENYIYIAIRRPMKTPESGTEVFGLATKTGNGSARESTSLKGTDLYLSAFLDANDYGATFDRIRGNKGLRTSTTASEMNAGIYFDGEGGNVRWSGADWNNTGRPMIDYFFRRATGFFDVVAYTGDGTPNNGYRDVEHNLAVQPEMIILKRRDTTSEWTVNHKGYGAGWLNLTNSWDDYPVNGFTHNDAFTATTFSAKAAAEWNFNVSGATYIAYLFATLAGVSKVGSYTGTGADLNVDCGFSAGARFILIKRTDDTGDWYVYDSARGIVAGNDPYLLLNTTAAEVTSTDYIDPLSSGFTVTSSAPAALNASGGTYIFLAIA